MWAVLKKELKSYFLSPIGYVAIGLFLIVFSLFFYLTTISQRAIDLGNLYYNTARYGLLVIVPIITMRMFAEERKNGTEQLLLTSPKSITGIVFGCSSVSQHSLITFFGLSVGSRVLDLNISWFEYDPAILPVESIE